MADIMDQVDGQHFGELVAKYYTFVENADKPGQLSVNVYSPLSEKQLAELTLIREISKVLQTKKDLEIKSREKTPEIGDSEQNNTKNSKTSS